MGNITLSKSFKKALSKCLNLILLFSLISPYAFFPRDVFAYEVTGSNNQNRINGLPHVNYIASEPGKITLEFVNDTGFAATFEYRTDGDESQALGDTHYNSFNFPDAKKYPAVFSQGSTVVDFLQYHM